MDDLELIVRTKKQIMVHEGFRSKPYRCTEGKLTIGYGRNLDASGISKREAIILLENDIDRARLKVKDMFYCYNRLNRARRAVLINMMFNLGYSGLLKFRKMRRHIESGNFREAAIEMLDSKWSTQVGYRSRELAEQMRTGEWV